MARRATETSHGATTNIHVSMPDISTVGDDTCHATPLPLRSARVSRSGTTLLCCLSSCQTLRNDGPRDRFPSFVHQGRECRGSRRVASRDTVFELFSAPVAAFQVIRECGRSEARGMLPGSTAQRGLMRKPCNANIWASWNIARVDRTQHQTRRSIPLEPL